MIYLDDIIIYSKEKKEHTNLVRSVLKRIKGHKFKLGIEKYNIVRKK